MAYLILSPFRIKADRIFSVIRTLLETHSALRSCHGQFIACDYLLNHRIFDNPVVLLFSGKIICIGQVGGVFYIKMKAT